MSHRSTVRVLTGWLIVGGIFLLASGAARVGHDALAEPPRPSQGRGAAGAERACAAGCAHETGKPSSEAPAGGHAPAHRHSDCDTCELLATAAKLLKLPLPVPIVESPLPTPQRKLIADERCAAGCTLLTFLPRGPPHA